VGIKDEATAVAEKHCNKFQPCNGTLKVGGKSQELAPANGSRNYIIVQNPATAAGQNLSTAESLFIRFGLKAGVNDGTSFEILPGSCMEFDTVVSTELVSVNAATAGHRWIAVEA
jgi:hypothetical protein